MSAQGTLVSLALCLGVAGFGVYEYGSWLEKQKAQAVLAATQAADAARAAQALKSLAAQDKLSQDNAVAEAKGQARIVVQTQTLTKEVPTYVTVTQDRSDCVPWGVVRVLDAAVLGVDPAQLRLPAGATDDTCSPVKASDLARSVAGNYGTAAQNAEQLNALEADIAARLKLANSGGVQDTSHPQK